jgi:hypothetical protein
MGLRQGLVGCGGGARERRARMAAPGGRLARRACAPGAPRPTRALPPLPARPPPPAAAPRLRARRARPRCAPPPRRSSPATTPPGPRRSATTGWSSLCLRSPWPGRTAWCTSTRRSPPASGARSPRTACSLRAGRALPRGLQPPRRLQSGWHRPRVAGPSSTPSPASAPHQTAPARRWANKLNAQVGFNQWQLGGEKLPLSPGAVPSRDGSDFWSFKLSVPADAYEVNMVFGDEHGNHDNNQARAGSSPGGLGFFFFFGGGGGGRRLLQRQGRVMPHLAPRPCRRLNHRHHLPQTAGPGLHVCDGGRPDV